MVNPQLPDSLDEVLLERALDVARQAAAAAAHVVRCHYGAALDVRRKADASPVTVADEDAERCIRAILREAFPTHAILGEELGEEPGDADGTGGTGGGRDFLWLVDPIDGTRSFVRGYPMFSTQIALMHRGELVLGVSSAPVSEECFWARAGGGAFRGGASGAGTPVRISGARALDHASISFGNLKSLAGGPRWSTLAELVRSAERTRGYGDYYHYHLLARGALDLVIESDVNILDIAALAVIVREAGGVFSDLDGAAPALDTRSVLAGTPALHAAVLPRLAGWR